MTENEYKIELINKVRSSKSRRYSSLLNRLYYTDFVVSHPMDANRCEDAEVDRGLVGFYSKKPCSVLEIMVSIADRCEIHIMQNEEDGNRTALWFWDMVKNMGLDDQTDDEYNEEYVDGSIELMLNRQYAKNGFGGLFTTKNPDIDMRQLDLWMQLSVYLQER